jgi:hypothetical protein
MKTNKRRFLCSPIALSLVLSVLSFSTAQAAEGVRWVDLPKKIGRGKIRWDDREDRQYRVVTKDGLTHVGRPIIFSPNDVWLGESGPTMPREQVVEIRIHRDALLSDALLAPGRALFSSVDGGGGGGYDFGIGPWELLLLPVVYGVVGAAAPVTLSVEAIRRRLPDKVVRVAP